MPPPSNYPPELLQAATQIDPQLIERLRAMQSYAASQPQHAKLSPLYGQLLSEANGGGMARLPEATVFSAAQGNVDARAEVAGWNASRDKAVEILTKNIPAAELERFRAQQRAAQSQLDGQLLQGGGVVAGALGARRQLINALGARQ